jgi:hypothetical protein
VIAVPALPLAPNDCFAPTAFVRPTPAVAERDESDCRFLGSFGLDGQRFYEFQHNGDVAIQFPGCNRRLPAKREHRLLAVSAFWNRPLE